MGAKDTPVPARVGAKEEGVDIPAGPVVVEADEKEVARLWGVLEKGGAVQVVVERQLRLPRMQIEQKGRLLPVSPESTSEKNGMRVRAVALFFFPY